MLLEVVTLSRDVGHHELPRRDLDSADFTDLSKRTDQRTDGYDISNELDRFQNGTKGNKEKEEQRTYSGVGLLWLRRENPNAHSLLLRTSFESWSSGGSFDSSVDVSTRETADLEGRGEGGESAGEGTSAEGLSSEGGGDR